MYSLEKGVSDRSFGLNVARMAGVPQSVVDRAAQVAANLEARGSASTGPGVGVDVAKLLASEAWEELAEKATRSMT